MRKRKKFLKFYKFFIIFILFIIMATLTVLYFFLASYEKSIPTHKVDNVITWINTNKKDKIIKYLSFDNNEYNDTNSIKESIVNKDGYFYLKNTSKDDKSKLTYSVYNENGQVGIIHLKRKDVKNIFNSPRWEIDFLEGFINKAQTIKIIVPVNADVIVNNKKLDNKYITKESVINENLKYLTNYVTVDSFKEYTLENMYNPNIQAKYNDTTKELNNKNGIYTYTYDDDKDLLDSIKPTLEEFSKKYTRYVVNENSFGSITPYLIITSDAYNSLKQIQFTNLWSGDHTPTEFSDFEYTNMEVYTNDAFSIAINYTYSFLVQNERKEFHTNIKLYLIKRNNSWYIVGLNT